MTGKLLGRCLVGMVAVCSVAATACKKHQESGGASATRWTVELGRAATGRGVQRQLAVLGKLLPAGQQVAVVPAEKEGLVYLRLVAAPALERVAAERLAARLGQELPRRLPVLEVDPQQLVAAAELAENNSAAAPLLDLATWLPSPGSATLTGLAVALAEAQVCRRLAPLVRGLPHWLCTETNRLGYGRLALASYRNKTGTRLLVLAAPASPAAAGRRGRLEEVAQMLGRHQSGRRGNPAQKIASSAGGDDTENQRWLPWGRAEVWHMDGLDLRRRPRRRLPERQSYQAWLAELPGGGFWVAVAHNLADWQQQLQPEGLGLPAGLSLYPPLLSELAAMAEPAASSGERLTGMGIGPLAAAWPLLPRRERWARPLAASPTLRLVFGEGDAGWAANRVRLADEQQAGMVYDQGFVQPRQRAIQRLLERSHRVRYEMALRLVEIGEVRGWHFRGARRGHEQLLYFRKGKDIIWLSAPQRSGGPSLAQLLERAETLPW